MKNIFVFALLSMFIISCKKDKNLEGLQEITSLAQIQQELSSGVSFVFYHASWCSICQDQRPDVSEVAQDEDLSDVYFGEVEYDDHSDITDAYNIAGFPIMVIYVDGVEVERFVGGGHTTAQFKTAIQAYL